MKRQGTAKDKNPANKKNRKENSAICSNSGPITTPTTPTKKTRISDTKFLKDVEKEIEDAMELYFSNQESGYTTPADKYLNNLPDWVKKQGDTFTGGLLLLKLSCTSETNTNIETLCAEFEQLIANANDDSSFKTLLMKIPKFECLPERCTQEEISYARWCLYPFTNAERALKPTNQCSTELELTSRFFSSLCNMCDLFGNATSNAGAQLNMIFSKIYFSKTELNSRVESLMPDRHVSFPLKTGSEVVRVLQEDQSHYVKVCNKHKDNLKMLILLKVCHTKLMREVLVNNPTQEHLALFNEMYTYGFLTCKNRVEIIGIRCNVKYNHSYELEYIFEYFNTFAFKVNDNLNIKILHQLCGTIMAIFSICAKQHNKLDEMLKTAKVTNDANISTPEKRKSPIFTKDHKIELQLHPFKTFTATILHVEEFNGKSIARAELDQLSISVYLKYFEKQPKYNFDTPLISVLTYKGKKNISLEASLAGQCLEDKKITTFKELITIIIQLLIEVGNIHSQQAIHNDIKRSNIVIYNGFAKMIDFEIMEYFDKYDTELEVCHYQGSVVVSKSGTPITMPPEKREAGQITPKSDVYSLGVVFDELLNEVKGEDNPEEKKIIEKMIETMKSSEKQERFTIKEYITFLENEIPEATDIYSNELENNETINKECKKKWLECL